MSVLSARALWVLASLLGTGLVAEIAWDGPEPPPIRPPPLPAGAAAASGEDPVARWAAVTLARPVFNPDRRPDPDAAAAPQAAGPRTGLPRLAGVTITPDGRRAFFAAGEDRPATVVREGATIGVWTIAAIRPGEVEVAGPEGRRTLRPSYSNRPAPAPVAIMLDAGVLPPAPLLPPSADGQPSGLDLFRNAPAPPMIGAPR